MISFAKLVSTVNVRVISQVDQVTIQVTQAAQAMILVTRLAQAGLLVLQAQVLALLGHLTDLAITLQTQAHQVLTIIHLVQGLMDHVIAQVALFNS
jgi:hypothetical protein